MNNTTDFDYFNTLLVQSVGSKVGPTAPTITPSAAYGYENAEEAEGIFAGEVNLPLYARVGNPTNAKLESIVAKMEGGFGAWKEAKLPYIGTDMATGAPTRMHK